MGPKWPAAAAVAGSSAAAAVDRSADDLGLLLYVSSSSVKNRCKMNLKWAYFYGRKDWKCIVRTIKCIKYDGLCIKIDEFCIKMMNSVIKMYAPVCTLSAGSSADKFQHS